MSADAITAEDRFTSIINTAIESNSLSSLPAWKKSLKDAKGRERRRKAAAVEATEAEAMAKELGVHEKLFNTNKKKSKSGKSAFNDEDALQALIQQRGAQRMESLIDSLESKYGGEPKKV